MLTQMMCNQKMLLLPEAEINLYLQVLAGVMITIIAPVHILQRHLQLVSRASLYFPRGWGTHSTTVQ